MQPENGWGRFRLPLSLRRVGNWFAHYLLLYGSHFGGQLIAHPTLAVVGLCGVGKNKLYNSNKNHKNENGDKNE